MKITLVPHHCWNTAITSPSNNTFLYLGWNSSPSPASAFLPTSIGAAFIFTYTGLSGIKKLITKNNAAGGVSAQNIHLQPHPTFHAWVSGDIVSRASSILTICAASIPRTIVIWFKLTIRPRIFAGLTSAIYIGASADATPIPMPPIKRAILNNVKSSANPVAIADTVNSTADTISNGLRPNLSAAPPATIAPKRHPTRAVVMATPCINGEPSIPKYNS